MSRPIRAVLFDLDGTLIDSVELMMTSMRHAFDGFEGNRPTDGEWLAGSGTPRKTQLAVYARTEVELLALRDRYRAYQNFHHDRLVKAYPGVAETLASLHARKVPMALVTSKSDVGARQNLEYTQLASYLPVIISADSTERHKPDPEPVRVALERIGVEASETAFVGDSPHDIAAGNAAGVTSIAALWGPFTREQIAVQRPAHWLGDIRELPGLVG